MITDLKPISSINQICKYADDTTLLVPETSDLDLCTEWENIKTWAKDNALIINMNKTKEVVFCQPNPRLDLRLQPIQSIETVRCVKLLGINLTSDLKFSGHIKDLVTKCNQIFYLLRKLKTMD